MLPNCYNDIMYLNDVYSNYRLSTLLRNLENELEERHLISALFLALTIPDICNGRFSKRSQYIKWFNDWVIDDNPKPIITGKMCYDKIRCGILHSGTIGKDFSLSCDSKSQYHIGHVISIIIDNNSGKEDKKIQININELVEDII